MPKGMQPIYTVTASTTVTNVTFNNIPQTYTDLMVLVSTRSTVSPSPATNGIDENLVLNGDTSSSLYSRTRFWGSGVGTGTDRASNAAPTSIILTSGSGTTANTFGTHTIYIPNYTSNVFKQIISDSVGENNNSVGWTTLYALLYRSNAPITSLGFQNSDTSGSTFTLYGISR